MLKSSSANVGATAIAERFAMLETLESQLNEQQRQEITSTIQQEYQLVCDEIRNYSV